MRSGTRQQNVYDETESAFEWRQGRAITATAEKTSKRT
jgi:hypothetical protein